MSAPAVAPTLAEGAFALAFSGLTVEEVLAMREAAEWRLLPGGAPDRFAGLLSVADLDAFLLTDAARTSRVSMADGGREGSASVPEAEYALTSGHVDAPML